jgi:hypothetical protein
MENQQDERMFTPEELEAKRKEMLAFYNDSMPYLKAQFEYEEILMKIDEVRFKRTNIQMQYAMMMQAQQEMESEPEGNDFDVDNEPTMPEQGKRKLRKE